MKPELLAEELAKAYDIAKAALQDMPADAKIDLWPAVLRSVAASAWSVAARRSNCTDLPTAAASDAPTAPVQQPSVPASSPPSQPANSEIQRSCPPSKILIEEGQDRVRLANALADRALSDEGWDVFVQIRRGQEGPRWRFKSAEEGLQLSEEQAAHVLSFGLKGSGGGALPQPRARRGGGRYGR